MNRFAVKLKICLLERCAFVAILLMFCGILCANRAYADVFIEGESPSMSLKNEKGETLFSCSYMYETTLSFVYSDSSDKWGFWDKRSGYLQAPIYDCVSDLDCDDPDLPILVEKNGKIGYLARNNGEIVIPFYYKYYWYYSEFRNGYAVVLLPGNNEEDPRTVLINTDGHEIYFEDDLEPASFVYEDVIVIVNPLGGAGKTKFGLGTTSGDILVYPKYDYIANFHEGYASVNQAGKWGHIDTQGNEVVPPTYTLDEEICGSEGYYFENGMAVLLLEDDTLLFIDYDGNVISPEGKKLPEWCSDYAEFDMDD